MIKESETGAAKAHLDSAELSLTSVANRDYLLQHLLSPVIFQGFHYDVVGGPSRKAGERSTGGSARDPELQQRQWHVTKKERVVTPQVPPHSQRHGA